MRRPSVLSSIFFKLSAVTASVLPENEFTRLLDLARYQILDTGTEESFDRITRLAARLLNVPVAMLNLVDQHRVWGKAAHGLPRVTANRPDVFCAWAILDDQPLVVEDAQRDGRFQHSPIVVGEPHIRMYAGAPLTTPAGHRIGTLCILDAEPRQVQAGDVEALQDLAAMAMQELEFRRLTLELDRAAQAQSLQVTELRRTLEQARILEGVSSVMDLDLDPTEAVAAAAPLLAEAVGADATALLLWTEDRMDVQWLGDAPRHQTESLTAHVRALACPYQTARTPAFLDAGQRGNDPALAWLPLGTLQGQTCLLVLVRPTEPGLATWRPSEQALLSAASRTVAYALARQENLTRVQS
nr:GAF domain-containing protein [Deinococcus arboris]